MAFFHFCFFFFILGQVTSSNLKPKRQIVFPTEEEPPRGYNCVTDIRGPGNCIQLTQCSEVLQEYFSTNVIHRELFCGYHRNEPKVCCPVTSSQPIRETPRPPTRRPTRRPSRRPVTRRPAKPPNSSATLTPLARLQNILPKDCGKTTIGSTRIVGGQEAEVGAWPWMVALYISGRAECGGALVTNNYVITAAHCVDDGGNTLPASDFVVRLGAHNLATEDRRATPQDIEVEAVIKNSKFDPVTYENDICLLKLKKPVQFRSQVKPACLPYDDLTTAPLDGRQAFVAGWGLTKQGGTSSSVLRQVQVPIWEQARCAETYKKDAKITHVSFCAGYAEGGKDSCQGDSGGPLMLPGREGRFYIMGLVSFGKGCALPNFPGIYTNVRDFLLWIGENMK